MRRETRPPLQEWVEEGMSAGDYPFERDLVIADEVLKSTPEYAKFKGQAPSPQKLGKMLARAGAVCVSEKMRIDGVEGSRRIWALRRQEMYAGLEGDKLRALFIKQRDEATAGVFK
jgi:hypothetical protein